MKYYFADFVLDTEIKELHHRSQAVTLTKKSYDLLSFLLENQQKIHTKDELVEHVWHGRIVSDNTIDQSISKLRKILNDHQSGEYIEAVYGLGVKFTQSVQTHEITNNKSQFHFVLAIAGLLLLIAVGLFFNRSNPQTTIKPQILMLPVVAVEDNWVQTGMQQALSQMLNYSGLATVVDFAEKPRFVDENQFIETQKTQKPGLYTIQSAVSELDGQYELSISVTGPSQDVSHVFSGNDISQLMNSALDWMNELLITDIESQLKPSWLPTSDHVAELYLRAMNNINSNAFEKARKELDLIAVEAPEFYLAKYQLAHVLSLENKHDESLALLNTLLQLPITDELFIATSSLKAYILDTKGQYDDAIALYDELFKEYQDSFSMPLLKARYEYSYVLLNTNQTEQANQQLDLIVTNLNESEHVSLLADVRALKGSLLQRLGQVPEAEVELSAALDLFERNDDALGAAKTYSALARIANQQANYDLAESYLNESLAITRSVGFKLGEGATLNELAYVMMVQGQHRKAKELVQAMEQIAVAIEYPAMQMAAKQLFFDMAREQGDWRTAERHLYQHHKIASETNNGRALVKNNMLALSLYVDSNQFDQTEPLITTLQQHIEEHNEIRMQPRLDWLKARIYRQSNNIQLATELLIQAKKQAQINEDGEVLVNINNTLADIYLSQKLPNEAMAVLNESAQYQPFVLPYLKLKAQTQEALGNPIKALETMNLCQQQAADLWTVDESDYLKHLIVLAQNSPTSPP